MLKTVVPFAALAVLAVGCTSYDTRSVRVMSPDRYPARAEVGRISLGADKLDTEQKWEQVFDTAPAYERGFDAINLAVFNETDEPIIVDPEGALCETAQADVAPADPVTVAESVLRNTVGRYVAGGLFAAGSSSSANSRIRADFVNKHFPGRVRARAAATGFIYCPNDVPVIGLSLRIRETTGLDTDVSLRF